MKIFYIAPYCFGLEKSMGDAFRQKGCEVEESIYDVYEQEKSAIEKIIYNNYAFVRKCKKFLSKIGLLNKLLSLRLTKVNENIIKDVVSFKPDIVFVVKGEILFPETLKRLKNHAKLVSYHWDDPFLQYVKAKDGTNDFRYQNLADNCKLYNLTFTYDSFYIKQLQGYGAKEIRFLMDWYDPNRFKQVELDAEEQKRWGSDVAFVGSPYENRIELLSKLENFDVAIWGPYFRWKEHFAKYPVLKKQYRGPATGDEAVKIYNASKIVLNIHDSFQCFTSVVNRTFEILACCAFELVDDRKKLYELFEVGSDLETYKTTEEAVNKIGYYLEHDKKRNEIRFNGFKKVANHSVGKRVEQVLLEIDKTIKQKKGEI